VIGLGRQTLGLPRGERRETGALYTNRLNSETKGMEGMARKVAAAALLMIGTSNAALGADAPFLGDWLRGDGKTRVHVASCGAAVCARNTWVKRGVSGERVGDRLVLRVKPAGAGQWSGSAFDPQRHETYTIRVHVAHGRMTTSGCVMGGWICESMHWTRLGRTA